MFFVSDEKHLLNKEQKESAIQMKLCTTRTQTCIIRGFTADGKATLL